MTYILVRKYASFCFIESEVNLGQGIHYWICKEHKKTQCVPFYSKPNDPEPLLACIECIADYCGKPIVQGVPIASLKDTAVKECPLCQASSKACRVCGQVCCQYHTVEGACESCFKDSCSDFGLFSGV
jgi:hypothetical protein